MGSLCRCGDCEQYATGEHGEHGINEGRGVWVWLWGCLVVGQSCSVQLSLRADFLDIGHIHAVPGSARNDGKREGVSHGWEAGG